MHRNSPKRKVGGLKDISKKNHVVLTVQSEGGNRGIVQMGSPISSCTAQFGVLVVSLTRSRDICFGKLLLQYHLQCLSALKFGGHDAEYITQPRRP